MSTEPVQAHCASVDANGEGAVSDHFYSLHLDTGTNGEQIQCPQDFELEWFPEFNVGQVPLGQPQDPSIHPEITGYPQLSPAIVGQPQFVDELFLLGPEECPLVAVVVRQWSAVDFEGSFHHCIQEILLIDTTPPVIEGPADAAVEWTAGFNTTAVDEGTPQDPSVHPDITGIPEVFDNCSVELLTFSDIYLDTPNGCPLIGFIIRTWKVYDACGYETTYPQTIDLMDQTPPVISGPGGTVELECNMPPDTPVYTATDNCGAADLVVTDSGVSATGCNWSRSYTATATDACGNTSSRSVIYVWVVDTEAPVIAGPEGAVDLGCNTAPDVPVYTASDNCGPATLEMVDSGVVIEGCNRSRFFTATATDACGNVSERAVAYSWLVDTEAPILSGPGGTIELECNMPPAVPVYTATDNCGPVTPVVTDLGVTANGCNWSRSFTATATDACGNTSSRSVIYVWVVDTEVPVIAGPEGAVDLGCNTAPDVPVYTATDNCGPATLEMVDSGVVIEGCNRSRFFTATATDACGNVSERAVAYSWLVDTEAPILNGPGGTIELECNKPPAVPVYTATDNCGPVTPVVTDLGVTANGCNWSRSFTATATDACGNSTSRSVIYVWVVDTEAPVIAGPEGAVDLGCNTAPDVPVYTATDNCGPVTPEVADSGVEVDGCNRSRTYTATATDACGNTSQRSVTYEWVVDTEAPTFAAPPGAAMYQCVAHVPDPLTSTLLMTDNCDGSVSVIPTDVSDGMSCPETITRTWAWTDMCGNTATEIQVITVRDTQAPTFAAAPAVIAYQCPTDVPDPLSSTLLMTDNCDGQIAIIPTDLSDGMTCPETIIRTWAYIDECGNGAAVIQTITVNDTQAPTFAPVAAAAAYQCPADVPDPLDRTLLMTDNCDPSVSVIPTDLSNGLTCPETITRTWTWTDICGNTTTVNQNITVNDVQAPTFAPSAAAVFYQCPEDVPDPLNSTLLMTDNCDPSVSVIPTDVTDGMSCPETITRTWTWTDNCNNTTTRTQIITVNDTSSPDLFCPENDTLEWTTDFNLEPVGFNTPQDTSVSPDITGYPFIIENCGVEAVFFQDTLYRPDPELCPDLWFVWRVWEAYDACGNDGFCIQVIYLEDTQAPTVTCPDNVELTMIDPPGITYPFEVTATDDCDPDLEIDLSHGPDFVFPCNEITEVTATAVDDCGNVGTCSFDISVTCTSECVGDISGDGQVDIVDFISFNSVFGTDCDGCPEDIDGDGSVGINDFLVLNSDYGSTDCVGSSAPDDEDMAHALSAVLHEDLETMSENDIHPELYKSIQDMVGSIRLSVYPNPQDGGERIQLKVYRSTNGPSDVTISLVDPIGRKSIEHRQRASGAQLSFGLDLDARLAKGIYMVIVEVDGHRDMARLLVE